MSYLIQLWVTCDECDGTGLSSWKEHAKEGGFAGFFQKDVIHEWHGSCWQCGGTGQLPTYVDLDTFWNLLTNGRYEVDSVYRRFDGEPPPD